MAAALTTPVTLSAQLDEPLVVERAWSSAAAAALALPAAPAGSPEEERALRVADRAFLAALQEATASLPAQVAMERDGSGRYFVATAAPGVLDEVLQTMRRLAGSPVASRHLTAASDALAREEAFREGSPRSGFEAAFAARLRDPEIDRGAARSRLGGSAWVVVRPGNPAGGSDGTGTVLLRSLGDLVPGEPVRAEVPADVVTSWVGSAYHFRPETTLLQADFLRLVLEGWIESLRDPALYELATEIDAAGRLLVRFSTRRGEAGAWEDRLDRVLAAIAAGGDGGPSAGEPDAQRIRSLMRRARGIQSRRLANPATCARAAAEALLRGASADQASAFVATPTVPPSLESVADAAMGLRLSVRVLYGT